MTIERLEEPMLISQLIDDLERSDMVFITFGEESDMHDWEKDLIIQALKAYRTSGQSAEDTADGDKQLIGVKNEKLQETT